MSGIEQMIAQMERWLGTGEPNVIQSWYRARNGAAYNGNFAWCNATITRAAVDSGNYAEVCHGTDYAYTVAHAARFRAEGEWHVGASGIRRGDIVFFDWNGTNDLARIDHVGIVTSVSGSTVYTIEGNIGNVCARKVRYENTIAGYGRPKYKVATKPPASSPSAPQPSYAPFPGASWFKGEPKSSLVTRMGKRLVANGCGLYKEGPGPQWTDADRASYAKWQRKLNYSGADANGWPGVASWNKLRVPLV